RSSGRGSWCRRGAPGPWPTTDASGEGASIQPGAAVERAGLFAASIDSPAIATITQPAVFSNGGGRGLCASPETRARTARLAKAQRHERRTALCRTDPDSEDRRPAGTEAKAPSILSTRAGKAAKSVVEKDDRV